MVGYGFTMCWRPSQSRQPYQHWSWCSSGKETRISRHEERHRHSDGESFQTWSLCRERRPHTWSWWNACARRHFGWSCRARSRHSAEQLQLTIRAQPRTSSPCAHLYPPATSQQSYHLPFRTSACHKHLPSRPPSQFLERNSCPTSHTKPPVNIDEHHIEFPDAAADSSDNARNDIEDDKPTGVAELKPMHGPTANKVLYKFILAGAKSRPPKPRPEIPVGSQAYHVQKYLFQKRWAIFCDRLANESRYIEIIPVVWGVMAAQWYNTTSYGIIRPCIIRPPIWPGSRDHSAYSD